MFFYLDRILETSPTGKTIAEKSNVVFLDMNFLYPSAMSQFSLLCGNHKLLDNPSAPNFPGTVEEN